MKVLFEMNNILTVFLLLIVSLLKIIPAHAEDSWVFYDSSPAFHHVGDFAEDLDGNVWAAAEDSICVFDGTDWTVMPLPQEAGSATVSRVAVDLDNNFWFMGSQVILRYSGGAWTVFNSLPSQIGSLDASQIEVDHDNNIWVSTINNGIYRYTDERWIHYTSSETALTDDYAYTVIVDTFNNVWIPHLKSMSMFDGETWVNYPEFQQSQRVLSGTATHDGLTYFCTLAQFLLYDGVSFERSSRNSMTEVREIEIDQNKVIWCIAGNYRVLSLDKTWTEYTTLGGLLYKTLGNGIFIDRSNNIFIATKSSEPPRNTISRGIVVLPGQNLKPLQLISPVGGEGWNTNTSHPIRWWSADSRSVDIAYSTDQGDTWTAIASNVSNSNGRYDWTAPSTAIESSLIRVSYHDDSTISDQSITSFSIQEPPQSTLSITVPSGGERIEGGAKTPVQWTGEGLSNLTLDYSFDNGINWTVANNDIPGVQFGYGWAVPDTVVSHCILRLTDNMHPAAVDTVSFSIRESWVLVTAPTGGEAWDTYSIQRINWVTSENPELFRVEYSLDGGSSWIIAAENVASKQFDWQIPNIGKSYDKCKIRISDMKNTEAVYGISAGIFTINHLDSFFEGWSVVINGYSDLKRVRTFISDKVNGIWGIFSQDYGGPSPETYYLFYHDNLNTENYHILNGSESSRTTWMDIEIDDTGNIWILYDFYEIVMPSDNNGAFLLIFDGNSFEKRVAPHGAEDIAFDIDGNLWCAADSLWKYEDEQWTPLTTDNSELKGNKTGIIKFAFDGSLWMAYSDQLGVSRKNNDEWSHFTLDDGLASNQVNDIEFGTDGSAWFATDAGVSMLSSGKWSTYRDTDGLANNFVNDIAIENSGVIWFATDNGISRFDDDTFFNFYELNSGLLRNEIEEITIDTDNHKWLIDKVNLYRFDDSSYFPPTTIEEEYTSTIPAQLMLHENHPNPFNPTTTISYALPEISQVSVEIYNITGQTVEAHDFGMQEAGVHEFIFDGAGLSSGMYFYRVAAGAEAQTGRMMLLK